MRPIFLLCVTAVAGAAMSAYAAPSAWLREQTSGQMRFSGTFDQHEYGFSVAVPPDVQGFVSAGIHADHGVRMILGEHRMIDVYPEYVDLVPNEGIPCNGGWFSWAKHTALSIKRDDTRADHACSADFRSPTTVWRVVQSKRPNSQDEIMYTLLLTTTPEAVETDLATFKRVTATFRLISIEP
jgi:hypothetical protein